MICIAGCYDDTAVSSTPLLPMTSYQPHPVAHIHHGLVTPTLCPTECNVTCGAVCNPSCCTTEAPAATVSYSAPSPTAPVPQASPAQCAVPCGAICAPGCTPACCYTIYRHRVINYWKRHRLHSKGHTILNINSKNIRKKTDFVSKIRNKNV